MNARMSFGRFTAEGALSTGWRRPRLGCLAEAGCPARLCLVADNDLRVTWLLSAKPAGSIRPDANISTWRICRETTPRNCSTEIGQPLALRTPRAVSRLATRVHVRPRCRSPRKSGRWRTTARSNGICPNGPCNVAINAARPLSISLSMPRIWLGMIVSATGRINSQRNAAIRNDLASVTKCFGMLRNVSF
jgi:hypothetical protein